MRKGLIGIIFVGVFSLAHVTMAAMSSSNFQINNDVISSGGLDTASSASYLLRDTVAEAGAGDSTSTTYSLDAGYRGGIYDQVIAFELFAQDDSSERTATALASTTITTDTTGLVADDFVVVIQDKGASQVSGIGKITSVGAGTITVDELVTEGALTIDGTNDFLYKLSGTATDFGTLSDSSVSTVIVGFNVSADLENGYTVQVFDDGDLRDGVLTINDVADGTVTAGSEEYGARSSDASIASSTFDTADTGISTSPQVVADETSSALEDRNFVTLKASVSGTTDDGSYEHVVSFIASGTY